MGTTFVRHRDATGYAVSLNDDGTVVAVSSPGGACGKVNVYSWEKSKWTSRGTTIEGSTGFCYQIGSSVSLSADGEFIAIGAGTTGNVRVYHWDSTWKQVGGDLQQDGFFGQTVSLSFNGNVLAITNLCLLIIMHTFLCMNGTRIEEIGLNVETIL